jgi:hypothetical protein
MTNEQGYGFVLWAIPRFRRADPAKYRVDTGETPLPSLAGQSEDTQAIARGPIAVAGLENPEDAGCLYAHL